MIVGQDDVISWRRGCHAGSLRLQRNARAVRRPSVALPGCCSRFRRLACRHGAAGRVPAPRSIDPDERIDLLARDLRTSLDGLSVPRGRPPPAEPRAQPARTSRRPPLAAGAGAPVHPSAGAAALGRRGAGGDRRDHAGRDRGRDRDRPQRRRSPSSRRCRPSARSRRCRATCRRRPGSCATGEPVQIDARRIVPGDLLLIGEGDRISADAHLLEGAIEVDLSTLTGESVPVSRSAEAGRLRSVPPAGRRSSSSAAPPAPAARRGRWSSPPGCRPSSAGSPRSRSGSSARRARSSARSGGSPG